jgi:hypothetical protein
VVILAASQRLNDLWMTRDYFPAMAENRGRPDIQPEAIAEVLGGVMHIQPLLVPRDCQDGFGEAFWGRPEAYLDPRVRANMSAFRLLDPGDVEAGLARLEHDLETGAWDARHGHLGSLPHLDTGHRIIVSDAE